MKTILKTSANLMMATILVLNLSAQTENPAPQQPALSKNIFKVNLTSLVLKNYNFQYERIISKRISLVAGYRIMPEGPVPFKQKLIDNSTDPAGAQETFDALRISNTAITPELRYYVGKKGFGRGFYLAPFYRFARYNASGFKLDFTNAAGNPASLSLKGDLKGNTYGLMMGAQWALSKNISLDWHILGGHYGSSTGSLNGNSSTALTQTEQAGILSAMQDIDIPLTEETYSVNSNGASLIFNGPWGGIRAAISLGIRF